MPNLDQTCPYCGERVYKLRGTAILETVHPPIMCPKRDLVAEARLALEIAHNDESYQLIQECEDLLRLVERVQDETCRQICAYLRGLHHSVDCIENLVQRLERGEWKP